MLGFRVNSFLSDNILVSIQEQKDQYIVLYCDILSWYCFLGLSDELLHYICVTSILCSVICLRREFLKNLNPQISLWNVLSAGQLMCFVNFGKISVQKFHRRKFYLQCVLTCVFWGFHARKFECIEWFLSSYLMFF